MSKLDKRDQRRMNKIRFRRADNGKYFSYFDDKEDAYLCLKEVARRYKHSGRRVNTITDLCEEYQDKGIMLYPTQLGGWLKDAFDVDIKGVGKPELDKVTTSIRLNRTLKEEYLDVLTDRDYFTENRRSWFINQLLMKHCGIETESSLILLESEKINPETKQADPQTISVLFYWHTEKDLRALYFGSLKSETKKIVDLLVSIGEADGIAELESRAQKLGYYVWK